VAWNVLQQCPSGSKLANKTGELGPEVARVLGAAAPPGVGEGLAGVSPDDDVGPPAHGLVAQSLSVVPAWLAGLRVSCRCPDALESPPVGVGSSGEPVDVSPSGDVGPPAFENGSARWLVLDLSDASEAKGSFDREVKSSDP
jgi:hypothetical protein